MSLVDDFIGSERILEASSRCHIRFEANSFVLESREESRRILVPSGNVLALVLESEMVSITAATLAACGEIGIPVVTCRKHLPVSLSLPIAGGWNSAEMHRLQSHALRGEAAARRLWRRTVKAKILAQAGLLQQLEIDVWRRLERLADEVQLDGQETTEAQAAALYWRALFSDFERSNNDDPRNGLLNWGYAVLLATVGRALVALGFNPALGFGHSSRTNPWALCSDLMEPFRPTIDAAIAVAGKDNSGVEGQAAKLAILRPFANDGPVKPAIMEAVRGYREFLDGGNEARVRYPGGPLFA